MAPGHRILIQMVNRPVRVGQLPRVSPTGNDAVSSTPGPVLPQAGAGTDAQSLDRLEAGMKFKPKRWDLAVRAALIPY